MYDFISLRPCQRHDYNTPLSLPVLPSYSAIHHWTHYLHGNGVPRDYTLAIINSSESSLRPPRISTILYLLFSS